MGLGLCTGKPQSGPALSPVSSLPPMFISKSNLTNSELDIPSLRENLETQLNALKVEIDSMEKRVEAVLWEVQEMLKKGEEGRSDRKEEMDREMQLLWDGQVRVTEVYFQVRTQAQQLLPTYLLTLGRAAGLDKCVKSHYRDLDSQTADLISQVQSCGAHLHRLCVSEPDIALISSLKTAKRSLNMPLTETVVLEKVRIEGTETLEEGEVEEEVVEEEMVFEEPVEMEVAASVPDPYPVSDTDPSQFTPCPSPYRYLPTPPLRPIQYHPEYPLLEALNGPLAERYQEFLVIKGVYEETKERSDGKCRELERFWQGIDGKEEEIMEESRIYEIFTDILLRKSVESQETASLSVFIMTIYSESASELQSLLYSLHYFFLRNHPPAQFFARLLGLDEYVCYPPALSECLLRLTGYLPKSALPVGGGKVTLGEVLCLGEELMGSAKGLGEALYMALRPASLSLRRHIHFLLCFKIHYLHLHDLFSLLSNDTDKMTLPTLATGLKHHLSLFLPLPHLISALETLDLTHKGVITRVSFSHFFSKKRFFNLCKDPEYSIETTLFMEKIAEISLKMRRRAIELLAISYISKGKSKFFPEISDLMRENDFETVLKTAENQLIGPFATVYFHN